MIQRILSRIQKFPISLAERIGNERDIKLQAVITQKAYPINFPVSICNTNSVRSASNNIGDTS